MPRSDVSCYCGGGGSRNRSWRPEYSLAAVMFTVSVAFWARTEGVRFTATEYRIRLSRATQGPRIAPVGRLYALSDLGSAVSIEYSLSPNDSFRVNRSDGWIYVDRRAKTLRDSGKTKLTARAHDRIGLDRRVATAEVVVAWTEPEPACSATDASSLCFASSSAISLEVPESVSDRPHAVAYLQPGEPAATSCVTNYTLLGDDTSKRHLFINASTAELFVVGADHEVVHTLNATVRCELGDGRMADRALIVHVLDINDNGPSWKSQSVPHRREETVKIDPDKLRKPLANTQVFNSRGSPMTFTVQDQDASNEYRIYILNDKYSQFKLTNNQTVQASRGQYIGVDLLWNKELVLNASTFIDIVFEDYKVVDNKGALVNKTAVVRISFELVNDDELSALHLLPQYNVTILRNASRWSRVHSLDELDHTALTFRLDYPKSMNDSHCGKAFDITNNHGIVYLISPADLHLCSLDALVMTISVEQGNRSKKADLRVALLHAELPDNLPEEVSCSIFENAEDCNSAIGLGSPVGYCTWQANVSSTTVHEKYKTCSPTATTCPNQRCDDLEELVPTLCPQDCTTDVIGNGIVNGVRGVGLCSGVCSCKLTTEMDDDCHIQKACPEDKTATTRCRCSETVREIIEMTSYHPSYSPLVCGKDCEAVIIAAVAFLAIVIMALVIWCRVHVAKEKAKRAAASYRPWRVDSSMSLPSMVYASSGTTSAVTTPVTNPSMLSNWQNHFLTYYNIPADLYDPKWELPRESIILEKNLGEGEFGMVMKARVKRKESSGIWCTAAAKMLKDGATSSEFADLLSEYKLLKEVSHNNVIKLIGAATRNGPFFVVVEYCEYGSLKSYLHDLRTSGQLQTGSTADVNSTSAAELLSFCWQIAKGMQYLSEVKLVHRDLAARNILIATGKVVKISDFGLTRDVYEADAYEKKSHGRIPVKWMAPESLYHQVYTSKSDVWSFGVVLWEIATLGATPYPGIPPERMYRLLQAGYRMDKPETCSSRLYTLMRLCWEADPASRPSFLALRQQLESMMEERVDYLHLTAAAAVRVCSMSSEDDSCGGGVDSQPDSPSQALIPPPFSEKMVPEDYLMPGRMPAVAKYPPPLFLKYIELQHQDE